MVVNDEKLGHSIYALSQPLEPGDSLALNFDVRYEPRGFRNSGASRAVIPNGTHFTGELLPRIGYQPSRELMSASDRRAQGLPRQVTLPTPDDVDPSVTAGDAVLFDAVIGTDKDQVAVAPGSLRRTWTEGDRRYFNYASDIPITGRFDFFSARYAVRREKWNDVEVEVFTHPPHTKNVDRLMHSARASLDYYSSQFGPYPYRFLQFVEHPGNGLGMGVDGSGVITGGEGIYLVDPQEGGIDVISEVVSHEIAHQWWGMQLKHAFAEGAIVLAESLAWYSGMQVIRKERGREGLRQFMSVLREPNPWPPIRTGLPLLRAMDPYAGYRKGPFAMYALSEAVGESQVNGALATLVRKKSADGSLATTRDLYRELQAVTPDSLRSFLHDLFEVNAFWTFDTKKATASETKPGVWQVTLDLEARKVVADSAGAETERPIDELVEIGIFAAAEPGERLGKPIYVQKHRIHSGLQTITITVRQKPVRGGIDPYNLLDWEEGDNIETIQAKSPG
jgi:hypothetical protein